MGSKAKSDGVRIFVAEKWVDRFVRVERHSERVLVLKVVLGDCLLNVFMVYAPHSGKPDEEKETFWNMVFHLVSCIPQNEMVVFDGDINGHIGSSNVSYDGTHGGFGYGSRNADGSRILEFADGLHLVICNTLFTKQEAKLVTCDWPGTITVVMVRQEDKGKVRNVKVISSEECVPKHKLLVMVKKGTGRPYSITEHRVPELIPVLGSQPAGDVTHKPGGKRPLLSAKPAVIPATLNRAATNFAAW